MPPLLETLSSHLWGFPASSFRYCEHKLFHLRFLLDLTDFLLALCVLYQGGYSGAWSHLTQRLQWLTFGYLPIPEYIMTHLDWYIPQFSKIIFFSYLQQIYYWISKSIPRTSLITHQLVPRIVDGFLFHLCSLTKDHLFRGRASGTTYSGATVALWTTSVLALWIPATLYLFTYILFHSYGMAMSFPASKYGNY